MNKIICEVSCPIEKGYAGTGQCTSKQAGVDSVLITTRCQISSYSLDENKSVSDVVTKKNDGGTDKDVFYPFYVNDKSGLLESNRSLNDNKNVVYNETFAFQGKYSEAESFKFFDSLEGKELVILVSDNADQHFLVGLSGGLYLKDLKFTTGQDPQSDFRGFEGLFENTSRDKMKLVEPSKDKYPNGIDDLISAITV